MLWLQWKTHEMSSIHSWNIFWRFIYLKVYLVHQRPLLLTWVVKKDVALSSVGERKWLFWIHLNLWFQIFVVWRKIVLSPLLLHEIHENWCITDNNEFTVTNFNCIHYEQSSWYSPFKSLIAVGRFKVVMLAWSLMNHIFLNFVCS